MRALIRLELDSSELNDNKGQKLRNKIKKFFICIF